MQLTESDAQARPLLNIKDVQPLSDQDCECMAEIAAVLKRYDCLNRFGLTLLHEHFSVGDNEILLETNDPVDRTLLIRPVPKSQLEGVDSMATSWRLDDIGRPLMSCRCVKFGDDHQHHDRG